MNNEEKILAMLEKMDSRLEKVDARLDKLEQGQAKLEQDIHTVNQRVAVTESKVLHELSVISEGIAGWNERNRQIDQLEDKVDTHGHRIWALEQAVKQ